MAGRNQSLLARINTRRGIKRWSRAAKHAPTMPLAELRSLRADAANLRPHINSFVARAERRLSGPNAEDMSFFVPKGTDWRLRPDFWCKPVADEGRIAVPSHTDLGFDTTLFHDCSESEIGTRQLRNTALHHKAPFGLKMDVFRFDGSFMSLVLDLPNGICKDLKKSHNVRLNLDVEMETPIAIYARFNIKHGPNSEQLVREIPRDQGDRWVDFDLGVAKFNEKRVEKAWIDLIFDGPQMNQIILRDVTVSRNKRAEV